MKLPAPNRLAVYLTGGAGLATAVAPAVASLDVTSTAGLATGGLIILGIANRWLVGWQQDEKAHQQDALNDRAHARQVEALAASMPQPPSQNSKLYRR